MLLKKYNIPVIHDLPGVGENLHDHWNAYIKCGVQSSKTYFSEAKPLRMITNLFRYIFKKESFLANPAALIAVFYKSHNAAERADAQIHFASAASDVDAKGNMIPIDGITIASCGLRPTSRGATHIQSANDSDTPAIQVNYMQTEYDKQEAIDTFRRAREICEQAAMKKLGIGELEPSLRRAVDQDGEVVDVFIQELRDARTAKLFFKADMALVLKTDVIYSVFLAS